MAFNPGLYVTATPIGNMKDITLRAIEVMQNANLILCEDTRITARLCQAYEISTRLRAYHDHNGAGMRPYILERLQNGERIVLISDAGTPLISDPGYKLVRAVRDAGLPVFTVPGASALTAALAIAGAPTDRFLFAGFLPPKSAARQAALAGLAGIQATLLFYETGPRLAASLRDMARVLGDRLGAVARELTKLHEEVREASLASLADHYEDHGAPKGEIVVIVHPPIEEPASDAYLADLLSKLLADNSLKDAASIASEQTGAPRKKLYNLALRLKQRPE